MKIEFSPNFHSEEHQGVIERIITMIERNTFSSFNFLGEGNDGIVYGYEKFAIKISKSKSITDPKFLNCLDNNDMFPKLYVYSEHFMITERIEGHTLAEMGIKSVEQLILFPLELKIMFTRAIDYCFKKLIVPDDLHLNNLMFNGKELKIIDVGKFCFVPGQYIDQAKDTYKSSCRTYQYLTI